MIKSVSLLNPQTNEQIVEFELRNPAKTGFAITRIDGLGPPEANINMTDYATKNGAIFNSSRVGTRNIVLYFTFVDNVMSIESLRQKSYEYFPVQGLIRMKFVCDNRTGYIDGYVESNEPDIFNSMETTQVSIICPNPSFQGSLDFQYVWFTYFDPIFHFPFANKSLTEKKLVMGEIFKTNVKELFYRGDSGGGAIIKIYFSGPVTNITVANYTTMQFMTIDTEKLKAKMPNFVDFQDKDQIEITTMSGNKRVTLTYTRDNQKYTKNILGCLVDGYQWITLQNGNNALRADAQIGNNNIVDITVEAISTYMGL